MSEHSPTPWRICHEYKEIHGEEHRAINMTYPIVDADNRVVIGASQFEVAFIEASQIDLRLIVSAVNSHAALVEACKKFVSYYPHGINPDLDEAYALARTALQQAGETT